MHLTPATIIGFALFVFALAFVPDKYKPAWIYRLSWWQVLIGLVATVAAFLIIMNPEFLAWGILGDSAFFDLLVLAIGIQLQMILSRIGVCIVSGTKSTVLFVAMGIYADWMLLMLTVSSVGYVLQRAVHRILS